MSSLWTPGGERPVGRPRPEPSTPPPPGRPPAGAGGGGREPTQEELAAQMAELRQQLASTPAEVVVANHAFGLFELAALHLSLDPPQLEQARTAIDALGTLVEGMAGRLGDAEKELGDGLSQLRMAFVQIRAAVQREAHGSGPGGAGGAPGAGGSGTGGSGTGESGQAGSGG